MKIKIVLIFLLQLFLFSASAEDNSLIGQLNMDSLVGAKAEWLQCKIDSDCSITQGACAYPIATNKNYEKDVGYYILSKNKKVCTDLRAPAWPYGAACIKGRCEANWTNPKVLHKIKKKNS